MTALTKRLERLEAVHFARMQARASELADKMLATLATAELERLIAVYERYGDQPPDASSAPDDQELAYFWQTFITWDNPKGQGVDS